ncbi:replicative DNA helicase [Bacillus smithii]|uniref:replicative DNA helicase n=1 Tax=Bacillus smithii TaxID=1479 RepID=UPI0030C91572
MNAEKALLGSFLKANYLLKDTVIKPEQLADTRHLELFKTMQQLVRKGKNVDVITLSTLSDLDSYGGISYINELASLADPEKFEEYEDLVLEDWKNREKRNILTRAVEEDWEIGKVVSRLDDINEAKMDDHTSIQDALAAIYEAPWQKEQDKKGVLTGFKQMDLMTNGFQDGELTIVAARPSMGKTDVMLHFAKHAGWTGHLPLLFSLEMPERSITNRLIASTGGINRMKMRSLYKGLSDEQKRAWSSVIGKVGKTNIQIFDGAGQSVAEMRAKTRKMLHQFPDKKPVIFIDYLTLIRPERYHNGNAHLQVTEISKNLKGMAKEFNCPVICLAQLSRAVEQRQDKRPMMSDIRESGSIEQDADVIVFLYREKYYKKDVDDDTLELIISKNRNGPVGIVKVKYNEFTGEIKDDYYQRAV